MKHKNKISLILSIILIIVIPLILYLLSFKIIVFNENFYDKKFNEYSVYENLKEHDIKNINKELLDYLRNKRDNLNNDFFNQRELGHLKDVKDVFNFLSILFYVTIIISISLIFSLYQINKKNIKKTFAKILLFSGILTFFYAFIFWLLSRFNFRFLFDIMHKTFFKAGTYVFDPSYEKIVLLYPQEIFYGLALNIGVNTLVFSGILILTGCLILFEDKTKKYLNKIKK